MAHPDPAAARSVPRRPVLLGLTAALGAPALAGTLTGCADRPPDPLVAMLAQARADVSLAEAAERTLRAGAPPPVADTLAALAAARRAHADALAAALGDREPPAPGPPAAPVPDPTAALSGVRAALDEAHRRAAAEVPALGRRRAALVGSIAACCAAYRSVLE